MLSVLTVSLLGVGVMHLSDLTLTVYGNAYLIGRNTFSCFGIASAILPQTPPEFAYKVLAKSLPGATATTKIVQAACARHHTVLVGSEGQVWAAGKNDVGQCGVPVVKDDKEVSAWTAVKGNWTQDAAKIVQVRYHQALYTAVCADIVIRQQGVMRSQLHAVFGRQRLDIRQRLSRKGSSGQRQDE